NPAAVLGRADGLQPNADAREAVEHMGDEPVAAAACEGECIVPNRGKFLAQHFPKEPIGAVKPGLNGLFRNAEQIGGLFRAELLDCAQHKHRPERRGSVSTACSIARLISCRAASCSGLAGNAPVPSAGASEASESARLLMSLTGRRRRSLPSASLTTIRASQVARVASPLKLARCAKARR